jgi:hypothetical protein
VRLAKIISALPVGRQVRMDNLRAAVGGSFKQLAGDLRRLQALPLPVEITRRQWATLTAPVPLCKRCISNAKPNFSDARLDASPLSQSASTPRAGGISLARGLHFSSIHES